MTYLIQLVGNKHFVSNPFNEKKRDNSDCSQVDGANITPKLISLVNYINQRLNPIKLASQKFLKSFGSVVPTGYLDIKTTGDGYTST